MALAVGTLFAATAQDFTVVSSYNAPAEGEDYSVTDLTNNLGVLYNVANNCSVGLVKNGEEYDLLARYNYNANLFISGTGTGVVNSENYIFDTTSSTLYYDADGSLGGEVAVATFDAGQTIVVTDIIFV